MARFFPRIFGGSATKAAVPAPVNAIRVPSEFALMLNPQEITAYQADLLYKSVSSLAKVIDLIADEVASLVPCVKVNGEIVDGHEVFLFLKRPGFNRSRRRLIKELTVQYLVTGTAYPHIIGNLDAMPVAIDVIKSRFTSVFPGADMWPDTYAYAEGTRTVRFQRAGSARDPRWIDDASGVGEIVPIYDMDGYRRGVGLSRLNAIKTDVELRFKGIQHNAAMLDNGARPSGVLSFKEQLSEDQREDLKAQLRDTMTGAGNAGKLLVTTGGEYEYAMLSQTAKDMDFANLVRIVEDAIVSRYNVPVTLFRTEAQTNNNYETAWYMFYNTAVLPTFQIIYSGLSQVFAERLGQDIEIEHDALTSPVLAKQASQRARELFNAHLISRNEGRHIVGYEPALGGDTIYGPMGEVPVGEDMFTGIDDHMNAEGFQDLRRERDPTLVPPEPTDDESAAKPDAKPKKPAEKNLRLVS